MKRLILTMLVAVIAALGVSAQKGMAVAQLFGTSYRIDPRATITNISGSRLESYNLDVYRSLTMEDPGSRQSDIESAVDADSRFATDREVSYRDGRLYYAFYTFDGSTQGKPNRYILYLNEGDGKVIVIYMEGAATPDQIKKLFNHQ